MAPQDSSGPEETAPLPGASRLLTELGRRVRELRGRQALTRSELAVRSGLSERFLARIEAGQGNISVLRLEALSRALETTPDTLVRPARAPSPVISLVGLRGAGKSTVGPLLATRLGLPFVELDERVVEAAGLALDQVFELHGEHYYRRLERECLRRLLAGGEPAVIAAAGGVVHDAESWEMLCEKTTVVWLRARPEDHWNRVVAQGDRRPMADNPGAMEELRGLLASRESFYARASLTADTTAQTPVAIADQVARRLAGRS